MCENISTVKLIKSKMMALDQTLSTAESCTGGRIASVITAVEGASNYYRGGVVTYSTDTKVEVLGVKSETISRYSVVSEEVAKEMAMGVRKLYKSDFAISVTGNAGPLKGDSDADIGVVCIGIASAVRVYAVRIKIEESREIVIRNSVEKALELILGEISVKK